jgi:hypothetical protein
LTALLALAACFCLVVAGSPWAGKAYFVCGALLGLLCEARTKFFLCVISWLACATPFTIQLGFSSFA